ncbi:flavodoxin family protein [Clostridium akagii]|uniref:flavodoxin family protein n=1 Tax=Clostridium akagii TaxID=91623 RepID=UPI00047D8138|nr:flavodoxin family protein [Clostridium akagii]
MKITIITSSPNKDGLTAACGKHAKDGAILSGAEVSLISLNDLNIPSCNACDNGWGTCISDHICQVKDDFQEVHASLKDSDGLIIISPVYWGDLSESAKNFLDRLRRCEAFSGDTNILAGKPIISVAAAGGTGNGTVSCLDTMNKFVTHLRAIKHDFISITQKTRDYKLNTIKEAASSLCTSLK